MSESFAVTGATTPPWPDPHPDGQMPLQEEYSRCLNPGKYRLLAARLEAWLHALTRLGLGVAHEVPNLDQAWRDGPVDDIDHAISVRPVREGALSLLVGFQEFDGVLDAAVVLGAGEPAVWLLTQPVCGCDACDDGSDYLLDELDDHVLAVVTGELVHVASKRGTIVATRSGWSADGSFADVQNIEALLAQARTGRSPHRVVHGDPWW
jgi:Family of unknown function (DUF6226)